MSNKAGLIQFDWNKRKQEIIENWEQTKLLEGLSTHDNRKAATAVLLELQTAEAFTAKNMKDNPFKFPLAETTLTATEFDNGDSWVASSIPLVRRMMGQTIAPEIVSVQPIPIPTWKVFYYNVLYGETKPSSSTGTDIYADTNGTPTANDSWYGDILNEAIQGTNGLYGAYNYGYSRNWLNDTAITSSTIYHNSGSGATNVLSKWIEYSASDDDINKHFLGVKVDLTTDMLGLDDSAYKMSCFGNVTFYSASTDLSYTVVAIHRKFSRLTMSGSSTTPAYLTFFVEVSDDVSSDTITSAIFTSAYLKKTTFDARTDFEYGQSGVGTIPEVNVSITSKDVTAKTRALKSRVSWEQMKDIQIYHSVDFEEFWTKTMSRLIALELDRSILAHMLSKAGATWWWSKTLGKTVNKLTGATLTSPAAYYHSQETWFLTLKERITNMSNEILRKSQRGGATFIVTSPDGMNILENMPYNTFKKTEKLDEDGIEVRGTFNDTMKVICDPYFPSNKMLIGRKGKDLEDCGYIWAPNCPIELTQTILDPTHELQPLKAVRTRDAYEMVREEFFGVINLMDVEV